MSEWKTYANVELMFRIQLNSLELENPKHVWRSLRASEDFCNCVSLQTRHIRARRRALGREARLTRGVSRALSQASRSAFSAFGLLGGPSDSADGARGGDAAVTERGAEGDASVNVEASDDDGGGVVRSACIVDRPSEQNPGSKSSPMDSCSAVPPEKPVEMIIEISTGNHIANPTSYSYTGRGPDQR